MYDYVVEKTQGKIRKEEIFDFSLEDLRTQSAQGIAQKILQNRNKKVLIINAVDYLDESIAIAGILRAANAGISFVFRTAASFIPVIGGIKAKPLLDKKDFLQSNNGGLIAIGSYVPKTTEQLNYLKQNAGIQAVELQVERLANPNQAADEISNVVDFLNQQIRSGKDVMFYTSRKLAGSFAGASNLEAIKRVSESVVEVIRRGAVQPKFLIAKGGITSSDIATKGLGVKRAVVRGQIIPGVPVWGLGSESRFAGMDYVIFPGNVGNKTSLLEVYTKIK